MPTAWRSRIVGLDGMQVETDKGFYGALLLWKDSITMTGETLPWAVGPSHCRDMRHLILAQYALTPGW